jgi:hypothetical protein
VFNVKVTGPPDKIAMLERGDVKPRATVVVTGEDAPATGSGSRIVKKQVQIDPLPDGVAFDPIDDLEVKIERVAE